MRKLLWVIASLFLLVISCKTKKTKTSDNDTRVDTVVVHPLPASENPTKYDSLKNELNKRRQNKKKN